MIGVALSLMAALGHGGGAVSARRAMTVVHPLTTAGVSLTAGLVAVLVAALVFARADLGDVPSAVWPWILALGLVQFLGSRSLGYLSVNAIGASRTALFISVQVPFAAFLAIVFTGEVLRPLVAVGMAAVVAALLLVSGDSLTSGWRTDRRYLLGCLVGLGAGICAGGGNVIAKQTVAEFGSPLAIALFGTLVAMLIILPALGIAAARSPAVRSCDRRSMGLVCLSGVSVSLAVVSQIFAVQRVDVVVVAPILATFPLWTLLLSHLFIARLERITPRLVLGAFLAVAGVIAVALGGRL